MLCNKKITARGDGNHEKPMDFFWIRYMGINKLGFSHRTIGQQYFGYWMDLFETYKKQYNFETKRGLYQLFQMEEVSSLDVL